MEVINIIHYLLKVIAIQGAFYFLYLFLLRNKKGHKLTRSYLLITLMVSFTIPGIQITLPAESIPIEIVASEESFEDPVPIKQQRVANETIATTPESTQINRTSMAIEPLSMLLIPCGLIALVLAGRSIFHLIILQKLKQRSEYVKKLWFKLFRTSQAHPFSFFSNVFIPGNLFGTEAFDKILAHECEHVRKFHSIDRLIVDFMVALLWFNPFIYLYRRALIEVHEYQADEAVIKKFQDPIGYQEILFAQLSTATYSGLVSHFNFSIIKKRIVMMNKQNKRMPIASYLVAIPATLLIIFAFSSKRIADKDPHAEVQNMVELAIDQQDPVPSILPLKDREKIRVTSHFGMRRDPIDSKVKLHKGIDFSSPIGNPIIAPADGRVVDVTNKPGGYGLLITLEHGETYQTRFGQLNTAEVTKGDIVKKGQVIGTSGNSGRSTGPHLHYEVIEIGVGHRDPKEFIKDYDFKSPSTSFVPNEETIETAPSVDVEVEVSTEAELAKEDMTQTEKEEDIALRESEKMMHQARMLDQQQIREEAKVVALHARALQDEQMLELERQEQEIKMIEEIKREEDLRKIEEDYLAREKVLIEETKRLKEQAEKMREDRTRVEEDLRIRVTEKIELKTEASKLKKEKKKKKKKKEKNK